MGDFSTFGCWGTDPNQRGMVRIRRERGTQGKAGSKVGFEAVRSSRKELDLGPS